MGTGLWADIKPVICHVETMGTGLGADKPVICHTQTAYTHLWSDIKPVLCRVETMSTGLWEDIKPSSVMWKQLVLACEQTLN